MKPGNRPSRRTRRLAFTLVELLTVIAIVAIIASVSIPVLVQATQASLLTTTSNQVNDQLNFARQEALSLNQQVEVRFYSLPSVGNSSVNIYRGLQSFGVNLTTTPGSTNALSRPVIFPAQVQIASSTSLSTLFATRSDTSTGSVALPGIGTGSYSYTAFRFRSDGSTTLTAPLCITLHLVNNPPVGTTLPNNWATLQVDPLTGRVQTYRP